MHSEAAAIGQERMRLARLTRPVAHGTIGVGEEVIGLEGPLGVVAGLGLSVLARG